jgi:hypothetical protein
MKSSWWRVFLFSFPLLLGAGGFFKLDYIAELVPSKFAPATQPRRQ